MRKNKNAEQNQTSERMKKYLNVKPDGEIFHISFDENALYNEVVINPKYNKQTHTKEEFSFNFSKWSHPFISLVVYIGPNLKISLSHHKNFSHKLIFKDCKINTENGSFSAFHITIDIKKVKTLDRIKHVKE